VPQIVLTINLSLNTSIIDNDCSKILLGLRVIERLPPLSNLVKQFVPLVDIVPQ
jgi:hypothetical protein